MLQVILCFQNVAKYCRDHKNVANVEMLSKCSKCCSALIIKHVANVAEL